MESRRQSRRRSRKQSRRSKGGNFSLAAIGNAAAVAAIPVGLYMGQKYLQKGRSYRKLIRRR